MSSPLSRPPLQFIGPGRSGLSHIDPPHPFPKVKEETRPIGFLLLLRSRATETMASSVVPAQNINTSFKRNAKEKAPDAEELARKAARNQVAGCVWHCVDGAFCLLKMDLVSAYFCSPYTTTYCRVLSRQS